MIDLIGYLAATIVLISFAVKDIIKLRIINSIGSIVWIVYGTLINNPPTIFVNVAVLIIHTWWLIRNKLNNNIKNIRWFSQADNMLNVGGINNVGFNKEKNKAFRFGEIIRWILEDDKGNLIGRVAAFINTKYKNKNEH